MPRSARRIEAGSVWINDHSYSHGACQCSWGGAKNSGLGREFGPAGFGEYLEHKMIHLPAGWEA